MLWEKKNENENFFFLLPRSGEISFFQFYYILFLQYLNLSKVERESRGKEEERNWRNFQKCEEETWEKPSKTFF